jgi:hypothetical protein
MIRRHCGAENSAPVLFSSTARQVFHEDMTRDDVKNST